MFKKILVGYDGSDQSRRALQYALNLSNKFNSELIILTAYQKRVLPVFGDESEMEGVIDLDIQQEYWEGIKRHSKNILSEAETGAKKEYPSVKLVPLLVQGSPPGAIMSIAQQNNVDLIILGSRGLGVVTDWILGSTSKAVVEQCKRPVLIIK